MSLPYVIYRCNVVEHVLKLSMDYRLICENEEIRIVNVVCIPHEQMYLYLSDMHFRFSVGIFSVQDIIKNVYLAPVETTFYMNKNNKIVCSFLMIIFYDTVFEIYVYNGIVTIIEPLSLLLG